MIEELTINRIETKWKKLPLGNVFKTTSGGTPSRKNPAFYNGTIPWVKSGELESNIILDTKEKITQEGINASSAKIFPKGTLLIALYGATIGKLAILGINAATNQAVCGIFDNDEQEIKYLYWFLFHKRRDLIKSGIGGAQPNISQTILKNLEIPLPKKEVQQQIVFKIEELFSELDKGIEELKKAHQQLIVYRQAVLKWAFENDLKNTQDKLLRDISQKIQIGPFGTQLHKEDYIVGGVPLINPMHIQGGQIIADSSYSIKAEKRDSLPNYILQKGDVIMGRRGEMGRCGLVTEKEEGWFCGTGSLYVRSNKQIADPSFLYHFLQSQPTKKYLEEHAGGTTMANLNLKIVNNIPIHLPTIEKQKQIVQEIESRLSVCEKIEETINDILKQAEVLRQSILKKAFQGKLIN